MVRTAFWALLWALVGALLLAYPAGAVAHWCWRLLLAGWRAA